MLFSLLKYYFELYITDTALKVSRSLRCFTTFISHGVENYFLRLWGTGISDAILCSINLQCIGLLVVVIMQNEGSFVVTFNRAGTAAKKWC